MCCMRFLRRDFDRYEGVRPIQIHLLRLIFLLVFLFVGFDSWRGILRHQGPWEPVRAAAVCMWASYSLLSIIGVFRPLKMLPIVLFEILYKVVWLVIVAWPLWSTNRLAGSPAHEMAVAFAWVILPIVAMPWTYAFHTYVRGRPARSVA